MCVFCISPEIKSKSLLSCSCCTSSCWFVCRRTLGVRGSARDWLSRVRRVRRDFGQRPGASLVSQRTKRCSCCDFLLLWCSSQTRGFIFLPIACCFKDNRQCVGVVWIFFPLNEGATVQPVPPAREPRLIYHLEWGNCCNSVVLPT